MRIRFQLALLSIALSAASAVTLAAGSHSGGHEKATVGEPGRAAKVSRTVTVDMTDNMRFSPPRVAVKQGETIRFVVKNSGQIKHEMVLGTAAELREHYDLMLKNPGMEHDEPNQIAVAPGKVGQLTWRFTRAGKVDFACLQPGHYDAGMKGSVTVGRSSAKAQ